MLTSAPFPLQKAMYRLSRPMSRRPVLVGIDIGIDRVQVATLGYLRNAEGKRQSSMLGWLSQSQFPVAIDPHAPPPEDWVETVLAALREKLPRCTDGANNVAVVSLPIPWIHYQTTTGIEFQRSRKQCDALFASSLFHSSAQVASWPLVPGADQLNLAATSASAAYRVAETIADVGYRVAGIFPPGLALVHAAPALAMIRPSAVLLLEFSGSVIAMANQRSCGMTRNLPACDIALKDTDQLYLDTVEPWLHELLEQVTATRRYVARLHRGSDDPLDENAPLLICGRAAQIEGIDSALASILGSPVASWHYAGKTRPGRHACQVPFSPTSLNEPGNVGDSTDCDLAVSLSLAYYGTHCASNQGGGNR